ncbi:DUF2062 domain-containing protein [Luteolibacter flavescens]|uniref:DUF2062 domain-containing protein n=2 Tax=Luteolibacter flavescens TaxID=1859460 RepID=A0ABT3FVZ2_9BACT|nr:DUF2062 domain-containing protein [Luteolibacter flavescens]
MKQKYLWLVRRAYRALRHPKLRHRVWWRKLTQPIFERRLWKPCRDTVAIGLAIGLFFGVIPLIPQSLFAAIAAMRMKGNIPFAVAVTWLSNPVTNVPIWVAQLWLGNQVQDLFSLAPPEFAGTFHIPHLGVVNAATFMVGVLLSGIIAALLAFPIVHLFSAIMPHHLPKLPKLPQRARAIVPPRGSRSSGS